MIPGYQTLMRPVLECASSGEVRISDVVERTSEEAGRAIGQSGDNGVDGVIDQDPLGVDQIYVQAKRYAEGNNIAAGAIRDFYGALSLKRAHKGIFVTTSAFSTAATATARGFVGWGHVLF
jgi:restriction endonuclease Mrr